MTLIDKAETLLPCPFCGETPDKITDATKILGTWNLVHRCKVIGPIKIELTDRQTVIDTWNRRAALPARGVGEYTLAPHLQKIVDGAKTAPHWDTQLDRLAPTAADAREAALAVKVADICDGLTVGYAKHKGAVMALADAKREILALIGEKPADPQQAAFLGVCECGMTGPCMWDQCKHPLIGEART